MGASMVRRSIGSVLVAGTAVATVTLMAVDAQAGGFAVREQSTVFQGSSFAGAAAGGAPSSMFWNPATITQTPGLVTEWDAALIIPRAEQAATAGFALGTLTQNTKDNTAAWSFAPSGYATWQVLPTIWLGLSVNSPFGLGTNFQNTWPGRDYALTSTLRTYNAAPTIAWQVNEWLSVGAGVQVQYASADLNLGLPGLTLPSLNLHGTGWGYGFTAGATVTLSPNTRIGLGWRSFIDQDIKGNLATPPGLAATTPGPISTTVKLPDVVSLGIRHRVNEQWTLLATAEWTNWSRIGTSNVNQDNGLQAVLGGQALVLPFQFRDGWFVSGGFEYTQGGPWTLRAGGAYEQSPITDSVRIPLLPDNDRVWGSLGISYVIFPGATLDLAYTHIWVRDTHIDISAASGNPWFTSFSGLLGTYIGDVNSSVDIISFGLRWQWSQPPAAVVTKG